MSYSGALRVYAKSPCAAPPSSFVSIVGVQAAGGCALIEITLSSGSTVIAEHVVASLESGHQPRPPRGSARVDICRGATRQH